MKRAQVARGALYLAPQNAAQYATLFFKGGLTIRRTLRKSMSAKDYRTLTRMEGLIERSWVTMAWRGV